MKFFIVLASLVASTLAVAVPSVWTTHGGSGWNGGAYGGNSGAIKVIVSPGLVSGGGSGGLVYGGSSYGGSGYVGGSGVKGIGGGYVIGGGAAGFGQGISGGSMGYKAISGGSIGGTIGSIGGASYGGGKYLANDGHYSIYDDGHNGGQYGSSYGIKH